MKIIHTADWHLGHSLNGWDREAEHRAWFARLSDLVEEHQPAALLISGDVFDGLNPSGEAMTLLYETLVSLKLRCPSMKIIMSSGNHDPCARLEAPKSILRGLDVHVVGLMRDGDVRRMMFPLTDQDGVLRAHVLAIPFLRASDLPEMSFAAGGMSVVEATSALLDRLARDARALAGKDTPLIAMAHLHCRNALESEGSERRILIGGEHAFPADRVPEDISYLALGHIHRPQNVSPRARYSGSCFPLSVSEIAYDHGVTLLDVAEDGIVQSHLPIAAPCPLIRVPATGEMRLCDLSEALASLSEDIITSDGHALFVHLVLEADGPASVLLEEAEKILDLYPFRNAGIRVVRAMEHQPQAQSAVQSVAEIRPDDLFVAAFRSANLIDPGPEHMAAFQEIAGSV